MTKRTFTVSHSKALGFSLHLEERNWRSSFGALGSFLDRVAATNFPADMYLGTGYGQLGSRIWHWAETKGVKTLTVIPITREQADAVAYADDDWWWLDE